jgi:hypothetical protein
MTWFLLCTSPASWPERTLNQKFAIGQLPLNIKYSRELLTHLQIAAHARERGSALEADLVLALDEPSDVGNLKSKKYSKTLA